MNCNCVETIQTKLTETLHDGKKILKAKMVDGIWTMPDFKLHTSSNFELDVEGMKKKKTIPLIHSFCPFCGTKIKKE